MQSMKSLTAWMAEITHVVATGPFGMTADQRQRLDGHIKTIQTEVRQFEDDRKRWEEEQDLADVKFQAFDFKQPDDLPNVPLTPAPPLQGIDPIAETTKATSEPGPAGDQPSATTDFPVLPLGDALTIVPAGTGEPAAVADAPPGTENAGADGGADPAPAPAPVSETAPKATTNKTSAKA